MVSQLKEFARNQIFIYNPSRLNFQPKTHPGKSEKSSRAPIVQHNYGNFYGQTVIRTLWLLPPHQITPQRLSKLSFSSDRIAFFAGGKSRSLWCKLQLLWHLIVATFFIQFAQKQKRILNWALSSRINQLDDSVQSQRNVTSAWLTRRFRRNSRVASFFVFIEHGVAQTRETCTEPLHNLFLARATRNWSDAVSLTARAKERSTKEVRKGIGTSRIYRF